jgi:biopolymer transport protein ExbD
MNGLLMFDNRILQLEELGGEIALFLSRKKFPGDITLLVCIDQSVSFGWVMRVIDALKSAGCQNIQIACDSPHYSNYSD